MEYRHGFRVYCNSCKSECEIFHDMESHQYEIDHCPFCGADIDEDTREEIEEEE
jgi:hypothetical protein|tara:strand:+ start:811 stop:972 length:162 start_codon:yes stop_codon:yes gene_type:complete